MDTNCKKGFDPGNSIQIEGNNTFTTRCHFIDNNPKYIQCIFTEYQFKAGPDPEFYVGGGAETWDEVMSQ